MRNVAFLKTSTRANGNVWMIRMSFWAPLALTFDGHDLWPGGKWTIAVADTTQAGQPECSPRSMGKVESGRSDSTANLAGGTWTQYLRYTELNGERCLEEGAGQWTAAAAAPR